MLRNQIKPGLPFYFFGAPREEGGFGLGINLYGDHYFMTEGTFSHLEWVGAACFLIQPKILRMYFSLRFPSFILMPC